MKYTLLGIGILVGWFAIGAGVGALLTLLSMLVFGQPFTLPFLIFATVLICFCGYVLGNDIKEYMEKK